MNTSPGASFWLHQGRLFYATKNPAVYEMAAAWAEQAQRCRAGEIDKEDYDQWRHNFPEYDSSQNWVKTPSKEFSDAMVEVFKDRLEKT